MLRPKLALGLFFALNLVLFAHRYAPPNCPRVHTSAPPPCPPTVPPIVEPIDAEIGAKLRAEQLDTYSAEYWAYQYPMGKIGGVLEVSQKHAIAPP